MYVNYDFDKTTQDTNISGGYVGFMLPPSVRNNFIGIERIKRRPTPEVNVKNLDRAYVKKMKDLENYYKLEVDYLPIEKRPTLAELGKKGKDLYDLYNKIAKNAKNKGDITRPQKKEPKNTDDDMETFVIPEGAKPPTLDGVWKGMDNIPMGIPVLPPSDEGKHDTLETDELFNKKDDADVWLKERMKLIETREADEAEYSDDWDEMEKEIIEDNFAPKDKEDIDPLDEQVYEIPENPFESMEQMDAPERELMRDD
jgi:hypothetical protein